MDEKTKLSPAKRHFWLVLVIFSLTGQIAWVVENMYFNVFIYKMFQASASQISLMVQASAVTAAVTTIVMGAFSDRIGKRKILMCAGYIAWGLSILGFALIRKDMIISFLGTAAAGAASMGISLVILMDCVMTFFGSTANDAAFNAWLTDSTTEHNRGAAEGINSMMPLIAILVVFGGFMGFDLDKPESWTTIYLIIGIAVLVIGVLGFVIVRENAIPKNEKDSYLDTILYGFRPVIVRQNPALYLAMLLYMIFGISIQIFMPFLIIYYEKTLGMADYVLIMAPAIILAAIVTAFYGRLGDRIGFSGSIMPALGMLMTGYILLYLFPHVIPVSGMAMRIPVFMGSLFMMSGYLCGMAVFGAKLRNETPENMAGRFQGLRIIAQVLIPGVIGPFIGAAVLKGAQMIMNSDGTSSFLPNANIFLASGVVLAVLMLLTGISLRRVRAYMR